MKSRGVRIYTKPSYTQSGAGRAGFILLGQWKLVRLPHPHHSKILKHDQSYEIPSWMRCLFPSNTAECGRSPRPSPTPIRTSLRTGRE